MMICEVVPQDDCWIDQYLASKLCAHGVDPVLAQAEAREMRSHILRTQDDIRHMIESEYLYVCAKSASQEWPF